MTQSNLYMDNDDLRLYIDVQPLLIDELENSKNAAAESAESAAQSATNAQTWLDNIISYKTNIELYYAQSMNSLSDWYSNVIASLNHLYQQMITTIQDYVNQARDYAEQAQDTVDNRVSKSYLIDSKAFESGEVGNNSLVLADIKKYAHSTFCGFQASDASPLDPKKFTKVGSPIVTSDGIASGFSYQNFLSIPNPPTLTNNNSWEVVTPIYKPTELELDNIYNYFTGASDTLNRITAKIRTDGKFLLIISTTNNVEIMSDDTVTYSIGDALQFKFTHTTNNVYSMYYKKNNSDWIFLKSVTNSDGFSVSTADICNGFAGSADLKTTSIIVDGVEVFSGNKTGIDTIKPVDFTAITSSASSPFVNPSLPFSDNGLTISADGIASGFSSSNLIQVAKNIVLGDDFEIHYSFTTASVLTEGYQGLYRLIKSGTNTAIGVLFKLNSAVRLECAFGEEYYTIKGTMSPNTKYKIKITVKNNLFSCVYSTDNGATWQQDTAPKETNMNITDAIGLIYMGNNNTANYWYGSIDLNSFKIYVKGELVYQPCLKIPYTESKTGSMVVDSYYRERVNDMYEQFCYANYYTLSDNDYTLPKGELYGMIENLRKLIIQRTS